MKPTTYLFTALLSCMLLSCKKDNPVIIDSQNLTGCPTGATCESLYTEQADLNANETFKNGDYRLFWARTRFTGVTHNLYIKAPMAGTSFKLNGDDIRAGRAFVSSGCVSCLFVAYSAVDGEVKGVNTTPNARADQAKWLVEAKINRAAAGNLASKDTVYLKQYFYPNFIYN